MIDSSRTTAIPCPGVSNSCRTLNSTRSARDLLTTARKTCFWSEISTFSPTISRATRWKWCARSPYTRDTPRAIESTKTLRRAIHASSNAPVHLLHSDSGQNSRRQPRGPAPFPFRCPTTSSGPLPRPLWHVARKSPFILTPTRGPPAALDTPSEDCHNLALRCGPTEQPE